MGIGLAENSASRSAAESAFATTAGGDSDGRRTASVRGEFRFQRLGLSLLRPYASGKIPVVLVHGLWGGPRLYEPMVKALEADAGIRGRFQFLTFAYSGSGSVPHAAFLLRRDLRSLRDRLDPERLDPAWDRMVLIGHSMGGVLCKMMAQESGSKLWDLVTDRPIERLAGPVEALELLHREMVFQPLPEVRRLIFITTPHRGSPLDGALVRGIASYFLRPAEDLQRAYESLMAWNGLDAFCPAFRAGLPTSIDQLGWRDPLLSSIDRLSIDSRVRRHSIIADRRKPPSHDGSDGLVPYASAHDPGATSELLVTAGHVCLDYPEVIGEVARILKQHATDRDSLLRASESDERSRKPPQTTASAGLRMGLFARPGSSRRDRPGERPECAQ
jgi:pimeloyl-ACP methyl ester carboxylesterase